ncbi:MAG: DNA gyrase/topoisomerase IV subunit A [Bacteroidota bacterium]
MSDIEDQNKDPQGNETEKGKENGSWHRTVSLGGMYENWFLDYASYVILERAVPSIFDGLKPVHRRILHAMRDLDDGRYNKVANLIGHTMKYHPHGDAAIGDALVALGQKDLLIDTQGNWGNILTGDSAAAPRYIEARLSEFAKEVVFNPKTTEWTLSYDGRNKEPVALPVKFPLLLAQGVEGIAVGLASKILPHNFNELIDASVNVLKGKDFALYPDFPGGGQVDVSKYNDGVRGGRIRVRSKITKLDRKTLIISEIPYGQNTNSLIDSVLGANEKGKIKIKKIDDNTAENVEIQVHLASGVSPDQTIDALYAFTNCEVSISPNACVIDGDKPRFLGVSDILRHSVWQTKTLLTRELEIRKGELLEKLLMSSLEKIFIENRIYRDIEDAETFEEIIRIIDEGLEPFKKQFYREITRDDIIKLTQIQIKRISKFDSFKADELMKKLNEELKEVEYNLENIVDYTIRFYQHIKKKYGKGRERLSELRDFENIEASMAAVASEKLFLDREGGFAGTGLRKAEYITDCSDIDDLIVFRADGTFMVTKVDEKVYVGKNIIHIDIFKRNDERTIYNMIYRDGLTGPYLAKRFPVKGITRDREYDLTQGKEKSKVFYFSANPNGEAEVVNVKLYPRPRLKKTTLDFDFSELFIRTRSAKGIIVTKRAVRQIKKKEEGISTLGGIDIWLDENVMRLNREEYGRYLGEFKSDDKIITFYGQRWFTFHGYELTTHFEENTDRIEKFDENRIYTLVYWNGEKQQYFVKRFQPEVSEKPQTYLDDHKETKMVYFTSDRCPRIELVFDNEKRRKPKENEIIELENFIDVKSYKAMGNRLSRYEIEEVKVLDPEPCEEDELDEVQEEMQKHPEDEEQQGEEDKRDDQMELNLDS